jgi:hypothetical protein
MSTTLHLDKESDARFQLKIENLEAEYKAKFESEMKTIKDDYYRFKAKHHNYLVNGTCYDNTDDHDPSDDCDYHKEALRLIAEEYGYVCVKMVYCGVKNYFVELGPKIEELKEIQDDIDRFKKAFPKIIPGTEVSNHYEKYNEETLELIAHAYKLTCIICKKEGESPSQFTIKFGLRKDYVIEKLRRKISFIQNDISRMQESPSFVELIEYLKFE